MEKENIKIIEVKKDNNITIDDFVKVEIKLGTIVDVQVVEGSDKLYKLKVDFGEFNLENDIQIPKHRTVFSGIKKYVNTDDLLGKQYPFVTNLAPRKMMGEYSEAMILAASEGEVLSLMSPTAKLTNGTQLR